MEDRRPEGGYRGAYYNSVRFLAMRDVDSLFQVFYSRVAMLSCVVFAPAVIAHCAKRVQKFGLVLFDVLVVMFTFCRAAAVGIVYLIWSRVVDCTGVFPGTGYELCEGCRETVEPAP